MTISQADLRMTGNFSPTGGSSVNSSSELGPSHRLYGVPVQGAARRSSNDDVLFRHTGESDLWSVVHLTWTSAEEPDGWPAVEFTGTFAAFREAYASPSDDD